MKHIALTIIISAIILTFGATAKAQNDWTFVVFETAVSKQDTPTSSDNPNERRFYVSNVVQSPNNIRSYQLPKMVDTYFTANVVDPFKEKGININYYDSDMQMNCGSVLAIEGKQDAEEKRAKCIEEIKERGTLSVYSFNWTFGEAKGLETANPTMIFKSEDSPNYQPKGAKITIPATPPNVILPADTDKAVKKPKKTKKH